MDEARLLEIERTMGEWVKVKELIAEIRRCWSWMEERKRVMSACWSRIDELQSEIERLTLDDQTPG